VFRADMLQGGGRDSTSPHPGYGSNPVFMRKFKSMLKQQAGTRNKNPPGVDKAAGFGQAKAKVAGRNNTKRTPLAPVIDPVSAAMQHSVRNRAQEQASNASTITSSPAAGRQAASSVHRLFGLR
jgi:hypothetical protein